MAGGVFSIEVGLSCNNYCAFCPQRALRGLVAFKPDLDTQEVKRRILHAQKQGFAEVNFTGGEPTIRKDLFELVSFAREVGFPKVSITTNGRMLAYRGFLKKLVESGLTGLSVSLHSYRKEVQDALQGVQGGFEQTIAGLRVACSFGAKTLDISTITLLVPQNLDHLADTLALAEAMGVLLHICQPFVVSRENMMVARDYLLDIETIVQALKEAARNGLTRGGRIKPYNIPPCLLRDIEGSLELQTYRLKTFKDFEPESPGKVGKTPKGQFFKRDSCASCEYLCPGFLMEHMPQDEVASTIIEEINRTSYRSDGKEVILAGLDFLLPLPLKRVLHSAKSRGAAVRVLYGGFGLSSTSELLEGVISCGVDEVCFVLQPPSLREGDLKALLPGNTEKVRQDLTAYFGEGSCAKPSLMVSLPSLYDGLCDFSVDALVDICALLTRRGGKNLFFIAPDAFTNQHPPYDETVLKKVLSCAPSLKQRLEELGVVPVIVMALGKGEGRLEKALSDLFCTVRWDNYFVSHSFAKIDFGFAFWSLMPWLLLGHENSMEDLWKTQLL
jgi:MoaA/NifB/PqqE/SkfB family radical SAM enzyme